MPEAVRPVDVIRVHGTVRTEDADRAAVEEPLEIRLHGRPFAAVMALPDRLRGAQRLFDQTGALHAAGLFAPDGRLETVAHPERIS